MSKGLLLALVLTACAENGTYCQSGPKYGTQCYANTGSGDPVPAYQSQGSPPQPEQNRPGVASPAR